MTQCCVKCGKEIRSGFRFCNFCGAPVMILKSGAEAKTESYSDLFGSAGGALRRMNGSAKGTFYSVSEEKTIGNVDSDIVIEEDPTVSAVHARVKGVSDGVIVQDLGGLNGIFIKVAKEQPLENHDIIRAGDHFFLFEHVVKDEFTDDSGTLFYATPNNGEPFRIVEIVASGRAGRACLSVRGGLSVGRKNGDCIICDDMKMSPTHFSIHWCNGCAMLTDHSENGTFIEVHREILLNKDAVFFVGHALFRVV